MTMTPQQQALQQVGAMQHQFQSYAHGAVAAGSPMAHTLTHQITTLKNDIATNKNPITVKKDMETLNRMIETDQRMQSQAHFGSPSAPGQSPGHLPSGPVLGHSASNQMRFGLKQLGNTLNQSRPHF